MVYVSLVLTITFWAIPKGLGDVHYYAARYLDKNTRIGDRLLIAPITRSMEDSFRLTRERRLVVGKYLREPVEMGNEVTMDKLVAWPDLVDKETVAVELDTEPDCMVMNQGTIVEVRAGDKIVSEHAVVLAIVPWGAKWLVLLPKSDIISNAFATSKQSPTLSIEALPEPVRRPAGAKQSFVAHATPTRQCSSW
jgi:hypothetical protein